MSAPTWHRTARRTPSRLRHLAGGIFLGIVVWLASAPGALAQAVPVAEDCIDCHLTLDRPRLVTPVRNYQEMDVHAEVGFGCLSCHGSGGRGILDPSMGFLSSPDRRQIPEMCGRCHSDGAFMRQFDPGIRVDQVAEYWTSTHGRLLRENDDPDVATCVSCHPAHAIRAPDDTESTVHPTNIVATCGECHSDEDVMEGRGIPTDQAEKYLGSIHGQLLTEAGDLSAPVCNDCHGNHGAAPPGVSSVRNVCGECHAVMADFFDASDHEAVFAEADLPGCATCHEHHDIQPVDEATLDARAEGVCQECHEPGDPAATEFERMADVLDSLQAAAAEARGTLHEAENLGMEVSQALFELEDVNNAATRARSAIHTFQAQAVREEAEDGFSVAESARERGLEALDQNEFRRVGLAVFAGIVLLLIAALTLKIREMDDRMDRMMNTISGFFTDVMQPSAGPPAPEELRMAACALLLEAAYADEAFSEDERDHLVEMIRKRFAMVRAEAEELVALVEQQREAPGDIGRFADLVAEHFSTEEKRNLLRELWGLVYSDGALMAKEINFLERIGKLLHMDPQELAETRRDTLASMDTAPDNTTD